MKNKHEWRLICEAMMRLKQVVTANKRGCSGSISPESIEAELRRIYRLSRRKAMKEVKGPKR